MIVVKLLTEKLNILVKYIGFKFTSVDLAWRMSQIKYDSYKYSSKQIRVMENYASMKVTPNGSSCVCEMYVKVIIIFSLTLIIYIFLVTFNVFNVSYDESQV